MLNKIWEWCNPVLIGSLAVFAPLKQVALTVLAIVALDLITGIWAAKKRGEDIMSSGLRRTISKLTIYLIAIGAGFLVEQYLIAHAIKLSELIGGAIGIVELKSILENANSISGKDLFQEILSKIGSDNDKKD